jgi:hypothetical protein
MTSDHSQVSLKQLLLLLSYPRIQLADFLALQPVLTVRSDALLHLVGSLRVPCSVFGFPWVRISCSPIRFYLPCFLLYFCLPTPARHSGCAHFLSAKSARCQYLPEYLFPTHESLSLFFLLY